MAQSSLLLLVFLVTSCTCEALENDRQCTKQNNIEDNMLDVNAVGRTAFFQNAYRVLSERRVSKPLFQDTVGHIFMNSFTDKHIESLGEEFGTTIFEMGHRTHWYDTVVKQAMARGFTQIVILGSGLDCRALRLYNSTVTFFEIDQASVQDYKMSKLNSLLDIHNYPARVIRGDYLELDLRRSLEEAGFDTDKGSLFVWEGNSMYFSPEQGKDILRKLLSFPHSEVAFDCLGRQIVGSEAPTAETEWFYSFAEIYTAGAGVSQAFVGPCDVQEYANDVPFEILEETSLFGIANRFRDRAELEEMFGSYDRFETTQGWYKYYYYLHVTSAGT